MTSRGKTIIGDVDMDEIILIRHLVISKEGFAYKREARSVTYELATLGGLIKIANYVGLAFYLVFVAPFRELDLAISFSRMKSQICR